LRFNYTTKRLIHFGDDQKAVAPPPNFMKAIRIHSFGDPDVLTLEDMPRPTPADGEVLIRVKAASVNPVDYKIRSGHYKKRDIQLPTTLGRDVAGIIEAEGRGVAGFKPGDEVYAFLGSESGGYAEYAIAKENEVAPKPERLDFVGAAAVPLAAETAWQALFDHGGLQAGERVLIHGAAGGVGHFAVQFARAKGATVIATASGKDLMLVQELGADEAIDYHAQRFEEVVRDIDLVIDLVGGETQKKSWQVLKDGGRMVSTLEQPSKEEAARHHAQAKVFMAEPRAEQLREIAQLIDDQKVSVVVAGTLPLAAAKAAHERLEHEHFPGKLVLTVDG
jgi:NADPH:quinone reductase-like Zn-dependent oxidoreductase